MNSFLIAIIALHLAFIIFVYVRHYFFEGKKTFLLQVVLCFFVCFYFFAVKNPLQFKQIRSELEREHLYIAKKKKKRYSKKVCKEDKRIKQKQY